MPFIEPAPRRPLLRTLLEGAAGLAMGLGLAAALLAGPSHAQDAPVVVPPPAPAAAAAAPRAIVPARGSGPTLWVVRDTDSTLYLFGTVHVLRPDTPWGSERVNRAFDSADQIWFEISNPDDTAAMGALVQQHGLSPDRPLSSRLTAEENAQLAEAAEAAGMPLAALNVMRPWMAGLTLSIAPLVKAGYDPTSGVELVLKARAEAAGKPIHGFETVDQQVRILAGFNEVTEMSFLRATLEEAAEPATTLDRMVAAWARGDQRTLTRESIDQMRSQSVYVYDALLVRRNADWTNQIQQLLAGSGTAFIAVGAAHLAGPDSVIAMLEERGIEVDVAP